MTNRHWCSVGVVLSAIALGAPGCTDAAPTPRFGAIAEVPVVVLGAVHELPDTLGTVAGCRRITDGVLVADRSLPTLLRFELTSDRRMTVGTVGEGPTEYRSADGLLSYRGDSLILVDRRLRGLLVLDPSGQPVRRMSYAELGYGLEPMGADQTGAIYFVSRALSAADAEDSLPIVKWSGSGQELSDVGALSPEAGFRSSQSDVHAGGGRTSMNFTFPNPFEWGDAAAVGPSGRLAIVRASGQRVEMWNKGALVAGSHELNLPFVSILDEDLDAERVPERFRDAIDRGRGKPPFDLRTFVADKAGFALLLNGPATDSVRWILMLRPDGTPMGKVAVSSGERPCWVGQDSLITVFRDSTGVERLRYRFPHGGR